MKIDISSAIDSPSAQLHFKQVLFAICPTGLFCREDRCQSFFEFELIPSMRPPLEECEAGGALRDLGVSHHLIDAPAEKLSEFQFLERIKKINSDLIILAVTFGSLTADLHWAKQIKSALPHATIGLRGAPCYTSATEILSKNAEIDFCVQGDYEIVFAELVTKGLTKSAGVVFRQMDGLLHSNPAPYENNLDLLPLPDRSQINQKLYTVRGSRKVQATIHVQRGCPFPCTFCLVHTVSGNNARHRSPESIAKEVRQLIEQGVTHFYLRAETFTLNKKWAIEVSHTLAATCPEARWVTATRVECVDEEIIAALKKGGCYGISFGVDVASKKIGEKVKKLPQLDRATHAMRLCNKHGVLSLAYFMIGFIWEDEATLQETAQFIRQVRPDFLTIHYAHPYPGTPYYEAVRREGLLIISEKAQSHPALELNNMSAKQLRNFARRVLLLHYTRPIVAYSILRKFLSNYLFNSITPKKVAVSELIQSANG